MLSRTTVPLLCLVLWVSAVAAQTTPSPTPVPTLAPTRRPTAVPTLNPTPVPTQLVEMLGTTFIYFPIGMSTGFPSYQAFCNSQTRNGFPGYLATITTVAENDYVTSILQGSAVIGGTGAVENGTLTFRWKYGPEGQFNNNAGAIFYTPSGCQPAWFCNWAVSQPANAGTLVIGGPGATLGQWLSVASPSVSGVVCKFTQPAADPTCSAQQARCTALQTTCTTSAACASCGAFTTQCNSLMQSCNWLSNSCRAKQAASCPF